MRCSQLGALHEKALLGEDNAGCLFIRLWTASPAIPSCSFDGLWKGKGPPRELAAHIPTQGLPDSLTFPASRKGQTDAPLRGRGCLPCGPSRKGTARLTEHGLFFGHDTTVCAGLPTAAAANQLPDPEHLALGCTSDTCLAEVLIKWL